MKPAHSNIATDAQRPSGQISITGLTKNYAGTRVVEGLDLLVEDGEFISLLGPSGCGKTTTLRCIAGLETPDAGRITVGSKVLAEPAQGIFVPPNKRQLGMVFQSYALWPHMSVFDNIAYTLRIQRRGSAEVKRKVETALEIVGLGHLAARGISELSGGQQQRVALARALAGDPRVLLLDEPLSNLDASLRAHMRTELKRIHREVGRTAVFVTHDQLEAVTLSSHVAVMNAGRIQQIGTPREVFGTPASRWVAEFVGFDNFVAGNVVEATDGRVLVRPDGWPAPITCRIAPQAGLPQRGTRCDIAVRGTSFQLASASDPEGFAAVITDVTYMGELTECVLQAHGAHLKARLIEFSNGNTPFAAGESVRLRVAQQQAVAIPCPP